MSTPQKSAPEPSEIAGRYQVVKKLGAGAFGTVYKAKDRILGRMVAIKTIRLEGLAAAGASLTELVDRFKREAMVSAQLKHPNIVTIYDIGETDGTSYLAMEFIDGTGLDRIIATAGKLPVERAAVLAAQVADALDFAHKHNVVHRDIKPANIMVEAGDRVKVTDFGIAKVTDSGEHLTMTGSLLGTPSYMSPEQARGAPLDGRSDLFSAGCVLYEMLAGHKAFRGDSITGLIFKIITEEPPDIRQVEANIPDEMLRIVNKALAKSADARYQTGREMADDLQGLVRAGSSPTMRQTETPTAKAPLPPLPPMPGAAPTVMTAAPTLHQAPPTVNARAQAGPTVVAPPPPPPRGAAPPPTPAAHAPARVSPPPARSGSKTPMILAVVVGGAFLALSAAGAGWYLLRKPAPDSPVGGLAAEGTGPQKTAGAGPDQSIPATLAAEPPPAADAPPATQVAGGLPPATSAAVPPATAPSRPNTGGTLPAPNLAPPSTVAAVPAERAPAGEFGFLDEEAPAEDGREAGSRVAEGFRGSQGSSSGGSFGTSRRFNARERSPRNLAPGERPAVATLRYLMDRQELLHQKEGRYGSLADLTRAAGMRLDVALSGNAFQRRGYRFELTLEDDGYRITAMPGGPGPRPFVGDDSGFIRAGLE
jgi:serine/threonine protein kinase